MLSHPDKLTATFALIVEQCSRSSTKKNLHPDPRKDENLAIHLQNVTNKYGLEITSQFQQEYERTQPHLSFLFSQISNAVLEKCFHDGRCHSQAAYALFELYKNDIFNVSLVCSRTGNVRTEHYYLLKLDDFTLEKIKDAKDIIIRIPKNRFNPQSIFFDTWSNQCCRWEDFRPDNDYTRPILVTDQALFKPLIQLFQSKESLLGETIWCLKEYRSRLRTIDINAVASIPMTPSGDVGYQQEIDLLTSPNQCLEKIFLTINAYITEFTELLAQAPIRGSTQIPHRMHEFS